MLIGDKYHKERKIENVGGGAAILDGVFREGQTIGRYLRNKMNKEMLEGTCLSSDPLLSCTLICFVFQRL